MQRRLGNLPPPYDVVPQPETDLSSNSKTDAMAAVKTTTTNNATIDAKNATNIKVNLTEQKKPEKPLIDKKQNECTPRLAKCWNCGAQVIFKVNMASSLSCSKCNQPN